MRGEASAFSGFVEDMKATAVEDEIKRAAGRRRSEKVQCREAAGQIATIHFGIGPFDCKRRNIDSEYIETAFSQPNCVRPGARADLERPPRRHAAQSDELNEQ